MVNNIIEECRVSPPSSAVAELTLPLTFFDLYWLNFHVVQRLLFYKLPISESSYIETLVPKLKTSLSTVFQHYLPLSGNLVFPLEASGVPVLRYLSGDSVPVVFAQSSEDFDRLAGNQPRNSVDFYPLIPEIPPPYVSANSKITPVFAVQVTLFPNSGISIGITNDHAVGDASVIVGFVQAWASINKLDGDSLLIQGNLLPFYDRKIIKDPYHLTTTYLNNKRPRSSSLNEVSHIIPANKIRATFVLHQSDIQALKNYVITKTPELTHVSSFTVTSAYIWTCWYKAKHTVGDTTTTTNEEVAYFGFAVDCRSRLDPPIPAKYFGNCLHGCFTKLRHEELVSKDGFLVATEKIGTAIHEFVNDKEEIINGSLASKMAGINWKRMTTVAGTTKIDIYDADFGWGKPEKFEMISIDMSETISLNKSRREEMDWKLACLCQKNR